MISSGCMKWKLPAEKSISPASYGVDVASTNRDLVEIVLLGRFNCLIELTMTI
jgi:hypothetical protein